MTAIELHSLIMKNAPLLQPSIKISASAEGVLSAIAKVESSFGANVNPRKESAYLPGGKYFTFDQQERFTIWDEAVGCSYGPWQIMYPTACELGFDSKPWNRDPNLLTVPEVSIHYVIEYLKKRVFAKGIRQLEDIGAIYNSGSLHGTISVSYVKNFVDSYNQFNRVDYV